MGGKSHPYIDTLKVSALIFFSSILIIIFIALYIINVIAFTPDLTPEQARENTAPPGQIYPRQ